METVRWDFVRVMVVDDDPVFLKLMQGFLKKLGCPSIFCRNGKEAVEQLKTYPVDICFMDIMMPEMNGIEASQIIREDLKKTFPIIAVTSSNMKATKDKCQDVGMNDFIVKPISMDTIQEAILRYIIKSA